MNWSERKKLIEARKKPKKSRHEEICAKIRSMGITPAPRYVLVKDKINGDYYVEADKAEATDEVTEEQQSAWDKVMQRRKELLEWKEK